MDIGLDGNETEIIISIFACPYDRIFSVSTSVQWDVCLWYFIQHSIHQKFKQSSFYFEAYTHLMFEIHHLQFMKT